MRPAGRASVLTDLPWSGKRTGVICHLRRLRYGSERRSSTMGIDALEGICYGKHMKRKALLLRSEKSIRADGTIVQITIWQLPDASGERPHGLKYSLFYGRPGERIVGYDNETGKGDHRHYRDREEHYDFVSLERLIADFAADIRRETGS